MTPRRVRRLSSNVTRSLSWFKKKQESDSFLRPRHGAGRRQGIGELMTGKGNRTLKQDIRHSTGSECRGNSGGPMSILTEKVIISSDRPSDRAGQGCRGIIVVVGEWRIGLEMGFGLGPAWRQGDRGSSISTSCSGGMVAEVLKQFQRTSFCQSRGNGYQLGAQGDRVENAGEGRPRSSFEGRIKGGDTETDRFARYVAELPAGWR